MVITSGKDKRSVEHVEHSIPVSQSQPIDAEAGKTLPEAFGNIDAETAKYLNPDIVIDAETNQRIKSMVCLQVHWLTVGNANEISSIGESFLS